MVHAKTPRRQERSFAPSGLGAFASWRERIARLRRQTSEVILDATQQRSPNQTLETNCRPASPLDAERDFGRAVCARSCASGGSRSALRWQ